MRGHRRVVVHACVAINLQVNPSRGDVKRICGSFNEGVNCGDDGIVVDGDISAGRGVQSETFHKSADLFTGFKQMVPAKPLYSG
jgi:hypothetical protein